MWPVFRVHFYYGGTQKGDVYGKLAATSTVIEVLLQ